MQSEKTQIYWDNVELVDQFVDAVSSALEAEESWRKVVFDSDDYQNTDEWRRYVDKREIAGEAVVMLVDILAEEFAKKLSVMLISE